MKQDYHHHRRYYTPHHFILYPLLFVALVASLVMSNRDEESKWEWMFVAICLVLIGWLSFMMRQHYALTLQDRIVRLEMRLRYYQLTGKRFDTFEGRLTMRQLTALRFASDEELPQLIEQVMEKNLSPDTIKKSIKNWTPDLMRV